MRVLLAVLFFMPALSYSQEYFEEMSAASRKEAAALLAAVDVFRIEDQRNAIASVWEHGLSPGAYWTLEMEKAFQSNAADAKLKLRSNKNFLKLLGDISIGAVNPEILTTEIKMKRKKFLNSKQLQALIVSTGQRPDLILETLSPQTPPYIALRASLKKVYPACVNNQWVAPAKFKKALKLGTINPAVISLKAHLSFLGYKISTTDHVYDNETMNAINDIQWNLRAKPDGVVSPNGRVWKFLNIPCMARVRQIQADMEKLRWFPRQFEDRYIFINLAMAYFVMVDKTQSPAYVNSFRTINGRPERKSPMMIDRIVRVILNPYWIVPPTIFIEDKVKEIRELPRWQVQYYFDSHNYEVWNHAFTKKINPESIDWWSYDSKMDADIYIRQRPNYFNALGVIKFELTNSFSVYLHDTNQRELFYDPMRLISSGCIRLEKPLDLGEYLLKGTDWDRAKIESWVAKPGEVKPRDTKIELKNPMPVYTVYLTSFLSSDGILRFVEDSYGQNGNILENLKAL